MRYQHKPIKRLLYLKKMIVPNTVEDMEKLDDSNNAGGNVKW